MAGKLTNHVLESLRAGKQTLGIWQMCSSAAMSRTLSLMGFDWVTIDCEHGNISDEGMHDCVNAVKAPCTPIVRIPDALPHLVKRALDCGAQGICVPMVNTPEMAKQLVAATFFPPKGIRGLGSPWSMASYSQGGSMASLGEYFFGANDSVLLIVQIETAEAVKNVDAIAAIEGVHMLLVGPFDLSNSLGCPLVNGETDQLRTAISTIKAAADKAGKWTGIYCASLEDGKRRVAEGWDFISLGSEMSFMQQSLTEGLAIVRGGGAKPAKEKGGINY